VSALDSLRVVQVVGHREQPLGRATRVHSPRSVAAAVEALRLTQACDVTASAPTTRHDCWAAV
jgi:hypothetical protein